MTVLFISSSLNLKMLEKNARIFVTNKYLRIKNWNHKSDLIPKSRDGSVHDFQEKLKKEKL